MLRIDIVNDATGDSEIGNYDYNIYVNAEKISEGKIKSFKRKDGYMELIKWIYEEEKYHLNKRLMIAMMMNDNLDKEE
jgi:hypothetical protein